MLASTTSSQPKTLTPDIIWPRRGVLMRIILFSRYVNATYDDIQPSIKLYEQRVHTSARCRKTITSTKVRKTGIVWSSRTTLRLGTSEAGALGLRIR